MMVRFFFFKQKTAYEMRISDWSSDVCSSDLRSSQIVGLHRKDRFVRLIGRHLVEQLVDPGVDDQDSGVRGTDETGRDHAPVESDQVVVEARRVEQPHRLGMIAELRPADRLPQLVDRKSTRLNSSP